MIYRTYLKPSTLGELDKPLSLDPSESKITKLNPPKKQHLIKAIDIASKAIPASSTSSSLVTNTIDPPAPCKEIWKLIRNKTLTEFDDYFTESEYFPYSKACSDEEFNLLSPNVVQFYQDCRKLIENKTVEEREKIINEPPHNCFIALFQYRAQIIDYLSGKKEPKEYDTTILMNKIISKWSTGDLSKEALRYNLKMADALIEKEPNLYAGYKARTAAIFLSRMQDFKEYTDEDFNKAVSDCEDFGVADTELAELRLFEPAYAGDSEKLLQIAKDLNDRDPASGLGFYYIAAFNWKSGFSKEAVESLEKAVKLEPENERFKTSLQRVKTSKPKEQGLFEISLSFSFDEI